MSSEPPRKRRGALRKLALIAIIVVLLLLIAGAWLLGTGSGARAALSMLAKTSGGSVQIGTVEGRLAGPLYLQRLALQRDGMQIDVTDIRLAWAPQALLRGRLHIRSLAIGELKLTSRIKQEQAPAKLPDSLALPLELQIDSARIERGTVNWGPVNVLQLGGFAIRLEYDGQRYRLDLDQLRAGLSSASGAFNGSLRGQAQLGSRKPYPLTASVTSQAEAMVRQQRFDASGKLDIEGSMAEMAASVDFGFGDARVNGQARLRPFSERPLASAKLDVQALDLAAFGAGYPQTRLSARLAANEAGGTFTLSNAEPGLLNAARLPLRSLLVKFRQDARRFTFDQINATLGSATQPAGDLQGTGSLANGALTLDLATDALNLLRLDARLPATRLAARLNLRHADGKQLFALTAAEPLRQNRLTLTARATLADAALALEQAELKLGDGQVKLGGHLKLADDRSFNLEGKVSRFRLQDLGQFAQLPDLYLNGDFSMRGVRAPQLAADLRFNLVDSRLAGHPLHGEGSASLRKDRLEIPKLLLAAGDNRLNITGQLAPRDGQLSFTLDAPRLAQLGPGFAGALQANGVARGSFERPRIQAQWQASQLQLPGPVQIGSMQGSTDLNLNRKAPLWLDGASIDLNAREVRSGAQGVAALSASMRFAPQPNAPLSLKIQADNIIAPNFKADSLSASASGTTARHTLQVSLNQASQQWQLQTSGGLQALASAPRWQGSIDRLEAGGRLKATLAAPATLLVAQQQVQLDRFRLNAEGAMIAIEHFRRDARGIVTRGHFERLRAALLLSLLDPQPPVKTDLQLGGQWDVAMTDAPRGTLRLQREAGDITMLGNAPVALGLRQLEASASLANGRLALQFTAAGEQLGKLNLNAGMAISSRAGGIGVGILPQAPVSGSAQIDIPSLRWAGPLLMPTAITDGSLHSDIALAGTFSQPRFSGHINGSALRLALPDLGVNFKQGTLNSTFQDTRLLIHGLTFQDAGGQLSIAGPIDLTSAKPNAELALKAERYPLLDRSDRRLVVSGDSKIILRDGRLQVSGELTANSGSFDIGRANKPQLSDDVVIVGRQQDKSGAPLALSLDLALTLGDGITIRGRGINALLRGQIKLANAAGEPIQAQGTLRMSKGTYTAYGRELAIERGILRFNGPIANPGLDILAMRRGQEVEAGVAVRGTVLAPRVSLVSEPTVPDAEKLSWLVLGRGLDTATGGGDLAVLQNAAGALLTEGAAAGVQSRLASVFGLDELSFGTSDDSLQQRIITVGKQVSARLYVSIEQGLETASSVLQLRYTLSRRLSLEVDAGTRTAFTVFYNFTFD